MRHNIIKLLRAARGLKCDKLVRDLESALKQDDKRMVEDCLAALELHRTRCLIRWVN